MSHSTEVVSAKDLVPEAFGVSEERVVGKVSASDALEYDLGHLMAYDPHPLDPGRFARRKEAHLQKRATENVQKLVGAIFSLPAESTEDGPVVTLPEPKLALPRHRKVPEEKAETRWERYARLKGITKKKRERMVWDEHAKEWRPRFGYKRVGHDDPSEWVVEVKEGSDPTVDPFEKKRLEKKERVVRNKMAQVANLERAAKEKARRGGGGGRGGHGALPVGIPTQLTMAEGAVGGAFEGPGRRKRPRPSGETKDVKKSRHEVAQIATASMGKFDRRVHGEAAPKRRIAGKKSKPPTAIPASKERANQFKLLSDVLHARTDKKKPVEYMDHDDFAARRKGKAAPAGKKAGKGKKRSK